jgi:Flp pilus assembly protein TadG
MRRPIRKKLSGNSAPPRRQRARRGTTALEYVIVASLIFVVAIVAVQHLAVTTGKLLGNSANATAPKP